MIVMGVSGGPSAGPHGISAARRDNELIAQIRRAIRPVTEVPTSRDINDSPAPHNDHAGRDGACGRGTGGNVRDI